jgi:hypothetical protein
MHITDTKDARSTALPQSGLAEKCTDKIYTLGPGNGMIASHPLQTGRLAVCWKPLPKDEQAQKTSTPSLQATQEG